MKLSVKNCKIISLPKFQDVRGNLSYVENLMQIPFEIRRTYWLYDVPGGVARGGHAEKDNEELIIALSGSFNILVDDGREKKIFFLNRPYNGLYIPKGLWREIKEFSTNAFALELGSIAYDKKDYIRDYDEFLQYSRQDHFPTTSFLSTVVRPRLSRRKYSVFDCTIIDIERHYSNRLGNLSVVENGKAFPFDIKRVYYLYDVPGGESRGAHAHRHLEQLIIAASGSFTVVLDDGEYKRSFFLNRPYQGIYVPPGMWRDLEDFSSGAVCMVLASELYQKDDYIRDYDEFLKFRRDDI